MLRQTLAETAVVLRVPAGEGELVYFRVPQLFDGRNSVLFGQLVQYFTEYAPLLR